MCCPHPGEKWSPVCCSSLRLERFHFVRALPLVNCKLSCLDQRSPTSLALGTGFIKDNFLMGWGWCGDDSRELHLLCTFSITILAAPPQMVRHVVPEVGDPWTRTLHSSTALGIWGATKYSEVQNLIVETPQRLHSRDKLFWQCKECASQLES